MNIKSLESPSPPLSLGLLRGRPRSFSWPKPKSLHVPSDPSGASCLHQLSKLTLLPPRPSQIPSTAFKSLAQGCLAGPGKGGLHAKALVSIAAPASTRTRSRSRIHFILSCALLAHTSRTLRRQAYRPRAARYDSRWRGACEW